MEIFRRIQDRAKSYFVSKTFVWAIAFLGIQLVFIQNGADNTNSRLAAMASACTEGNFEISEYVFRQDENHNSLSWTLDWSHMPNRGYYSNKAPGPILIGLPLYCALDALWNKDGKTGIARINEQSTTLLVADLFLAFLLQALPFALLVIWFDRWFRREALSSEARRFANVALYFGTTLSLFMNTWFGHGLAAFFTLLTLAALLKRSNLLSGFALGMAIISEYYLLLLIPGFIAALWLRERQRAQGLSQESNPASTFRLMLNSILNIGIGALLPLALGAWYHYVCFGNILYTPYKFQNPIFLDSGDQAFNLLGIFRLPSPFILFKLLFGFERGLLWTQPWVLLVIFPSIKLLRTANTNARMIIVFSLSSFFLLLAMNSSFGGWHGGWTSGPRYLSPALALMCLVGAYIVDISSKLMRRTLAALLVFSVSLTGIFLSTTIRAENGLPIWKSPLSILQRYPIQVFPSCITFSLILIAAYTITRLLKVSRTVE